MTEENIRKEEYYLYVIIPQLKVLAQNCREQGLSLFALCEWGPGKFGKFLTTQPDCTFNSVVAASSLELADDCPPRRSAYSPQQAESCWFDVKVYPTKAGWEGRDDDLLWIDQILSKEDAIECATGDEFATAYQVVVVACGEHAEYENGEYVFKRVERW